MSVFLFFLQLGHRAECWNVEKWIAEVAVKVVRLSNDEASIILSDRSAGSTSDPTDGELFAECPVTLPLFTCVEPVIDSSRYFVIRVVDRESGRHVFLGLGFREREEASDFNAALSEHQAYLERKEAAASMKKAFDDAYKEQAIQGEDKQTGTAPTPESEKDGQKAEAPPPLLVDYSLKPGEKLHLSLGSSGNTSNNGRNGSNFLSKKLTKTFSLMFDPENGGDRAPIAALRIEAPPPPPSRTRLAKPTMGIYPSYRAAAAVAASEIAKKDEDTPWGEFEAAAEVKD